MASSEQTDSWMKPAQHVDKEQNAEITCSMWNKTYDKQQAFVIVFNNLQWCIRQAMATRQENGVAGFKWSSLLDF